MFNFPRKKDRPRCDHCRADDELLHIGALEFGTLHRITGEEALVCPHCYGRLAARHFVRSGEENLRVVGCGVVTLEFACVSPVVETRVTTVTARALRPRRVTHLPLTVEAVKAHASGGADLEKAAAKVTVQICKARRLCGRRGDVIMASAQVPTDEWGLIVERATVHHGRAFDMLSWSEADCDWWLSTIARRAC